MDEKYALTEEQMQEIYENELANWKRDLNILAVRAEVFKITENERALKEIEGNIEECLKAIKHLESKLDS